MWNACKNVRFYYIVWKHRRPTTISQTYVIACYRTEYSKYRTQVYLKFLITYELNIYRFLFLKNVVGIWKLPSFSTKNKKKIYEKYRNLLHLLFGWLCSGLPNPWTAERAQTVRTRHVATYYSTVTDRNNM